MVNREEWEFSMVWSPKEFYLLWLRCGRGVRRELAILQYMEVIVLLDIVEKELTFIRFTWFVSNEMDTAYMGRKQREGGNENVEKWFVV